MGHANKSSKGIFTSIENRFKNWAVPKIPKCIETYHLTLLTILWSILIIMFGWLARYNIQWFWGASFFIFMQWVTDLFDGELGRQRNTGLVKWGFYMDHFLDYIFLSSILISYIFTLPVEFWPYLFFVLMVFGGFMVNSFLFFGATGNMRIHQEGIGPTEMRLAFILNNILVVTIKPVFLANFLPLVLIFATLILTYIVYKDHKILWKLDMKNKKNSTKKK